MWCVIRHDLYTIEAIAYFTRACDASSYSVEMAVLNPGVRFYPRLESNFRRRPIDDLPAGSGTRNHGRIKVLKSKNLSTRKREVMPARKA